MWCWHSCRHLPSPIASPRLCLTACEHQRRPDPITDHPFRIALNGYSYTREHTCDQWELDSYFSDVEDYVNELQTYLDEINEYSRKVTLLARDAEAYAVCEAEEVSTQHE